MIIWSQSSNLKYIYWNHLFPLIFWSLSFCGCHWIAQSEFDGSNFEDFVSSSFTIFNSSFSTSNIFPHIFSLQQSAQNWIFFGIERKRGYGQNMFFSKLRWWRCQGNGDSSNCSIDWLWSSCWVLTKYRHSETADYKRGGSRDQN